MTFDPEIHHHRSIRLRGYDYSRPGTYYFTICTQGKEHLLGEVVEGETVPNQPGLMVERIWKQMPPLFPMVETVEHVVMPNHFHAVFRIAGRDCRGAPCGRSRAGTRPAPTVGRIVGAFKSLTSAEYIRGVEQSGLPRFEVRFWQRGFYEHIVRNEDELHKIREYIRTNPARWERDPYW